MFNLHVSCLTNPGRTYTVVNDRLRRKTEIYGDRTRLPYTMRVYGVIRWETDFVYGDRKKNTEWIKDKHLCSVYRDIRQPYTVVYHRVLSYTIVYGHRMNNVKNFVGENEWAQLEQSRRETVQAMSLIRTAFLVGRIISFTFKWILNKP
jgi:hypothetical protein